MLCRRCSRFLHASNTSGACRWCRPLLGLVPRRAEQPALERFLALASTDGTCWEWMGRRDKDGYGSFRMSPSETDLAHRASWRLHRGPIPEGLFVLHRCDNPPCVNPEHLFLGTQADNVHDMYAKQRDRFARAVQQTNEANGGTNDEVTDETDR